MEILSGETYNWCLSDLNIRHLQSASLDIRCSNVSSALDITPQRTLSQLQRTIMMWDYKRM